MGGHGYVAKYKNIVTPRQAERMGLVSKQDRNIIKPKHIGGEWYAKVDPDTGAIQWLRKKIKRKK